MDIKFQKVINQGQIDSLCAIAKKVWHITYDSILPPGQVEYMLEKFQSAFAIKDQIANQGYKYHLIICDGAEAGFVGFSPRYMGRNELFVSKVYLLPEYQGSGAAREAFSLAEQEAKKEKLPCITLTVNKENEHAVNVYRHFGFQVKDKVQTDIGAGYIMDDYIMVKNL